MSHYLLAYKEAKRVCSVKSFPGGVSYTFHVHSLTNDTSLVQNFTHTFELPLLMRIEVFA